MSLTPIASSPPAVRDRGNAIAAAQAWFDGGGLKADIERRIAWRTESQRTDAGPVLHGYLADEIGPSLATLGFTCRIVENPVAGSGPFLIAQRMEDPSRPTVLLYGHGDVVRG